MWDMTLSYVGRESNLWAEGVEIQEFVAFDLYVIVMAHWRVGHDSFRQETVE